MNPLAQPGKLVLNVDGDAAVRNIRTQIIRTADLDVIEADDGPAALVLITQQHPNLVLLDGRLPEIDGMDVGQRIKAEWPDIIVIKISSPLVMRAAEVGIPNGGADCCLTTRVDPHDLMTVTCAMLRLRGADIQARQHDEHYRMIIETATECAVITCDLDGRITSWNAGAEMIFRQSPAEVIGKSHEYIFADTDIAADRPEQTTSGAPSGLNVESECWHQRSDGSLFWSSSRVLPLLDRGGSISGYLKILHDRSEQHAFRDAVNADLEQRVADRTRELAAANANLLAEIAEHDRTAEQLRQAQKMETLGHLTGGIAHDFNNLLTAIMGGLEVMRLRIEDPRTLRLIDSSMNAAERGARLIAQLVAFARKQKLHVERVDLNRLVSSMRQELERVVGAPAKVSLALDPKAWPVLADAGQVRMALRNLSGNARASMESGGLLTISTGNESVAASASGSTLPAGDYGTFCLRDNGKGMSEDVLAHLFEPFFTTKDVGKGSGLDLAQVYGFVRQSGGDIRVSSRPGHGTSLTILLPRAPEIAGEAPTQEADA
ncbi:ATP-binding response regulator [Rhodopila sp.]|uniref:ATP-binding response regulator n=1 Tax=Rhodopila sp. TaxID=2480087 RepID=UPI003D0E6E05